MAPLVNDGAHFHAFRRLVLNWFDRPILSFIASCTLSSHLFPYCRPQLNIDGFHSYENSRRLFNYFLSKRFYNRNRDIYPEPPLDSDGPVELELRE